MWTCSPKYQKLVCNVSRETDIREEATVRNSHVVDDERMAGCVPIKCLVPPGYDSFERSNNKGIVGVHQVTTIRLPVIRHKGSKVQPGRYVV